MRFPVFILLCLSLLTPLQAQTGDTLVTDNDNPAFGVTDEFLPVEDAYQLSVEFEAADQLRLNWQIADGYYLYRHGFKLELTHNGQSIALAPEIPSGLSHDDEYFGRVEVYYRQADIYLASLPPGENLSLSVTSQGCADAGLCYPPQTLFFSLNSQTQTVSSLSQAPEPVTAAQAEDRSLVYMLILAMLGGMILNLMPCVFPVLSLKVLSFARDKDHDHKLHGWVYSAGVVASFVFIAAILMSLKAAGEAIGWGFHLQSPWFVASLAYLFFIMGLGLSGLVEMGSNWMNFGGRLSDQSGYSGSFFTGVLATVVASPCTAPFMGTALGFAVTQPTIIALAVFAALGFGMALPLLILSYSPALLNKIPRPGAWMETLKQLLAFPLYATAAWLCWVAGKQVGVNAMGLILLGCILLAMAMWLWNSNLFRRSLSALCAAAAISFLSSSFLQTSAEPVATNWQHYSPDTLASLRQEGKPVFVNITADWCITCLANEKLTLNTAPVKKALLEGNIVYLKGDWTNYDPQITALLTEFNRTGIPLYLFYPANNSGETVLLPQILTTDVLLRTFKEQ